MWRTVDGGQTGGGVVHEPLVSLVPSEGKTMSTRHSGTHSETWTVSEPKE